MKAQPPRSFLTHLLHATVATLAYQGGRLVGATRPGPAPQPAVDCYEAFASYSNATAAYQAASNDLVRPNPCPREACGAGLPFPCTLTPACLRYEEEMSAAEDAQQEAAAMRGEACEELRFCPEPPQGCAQ